NSGPTVTGWMSTPSMVPAATVNEYGGRWATRSAGGTAGTGGVAGDGTGGVADGELADAAGWAVPAPGPGPPMARSTSTGTDEAVTRTSAPAAVAPTARRRRWRAASRRAPASTGSG